jgi:hypothetical protein
MVSGFRQELMTWFAKHLCRHVYLLANRRMRQRIGFSTFQRGQVWSPACGHEADPRNNGKSRMSPFAGLQPGSKCP